ncbi:MAG: hypothetical protein U9R58_15445 [Chloroflexota bacterium]|nr:hypothetical protein [Chloroflexota bacterium]
MDVTQLDFDIDKELAALLEEITPPGFHEEYPGMLLPELPEEARFQLAVELLQQRNKVTHIYELVKAFGSTNQVTFNRQERRWMRKDAIAEKHAKEISVNPFTGVESTGVEHAPFVYAKDPRKDLPAQLQGHITDELKGKDAVIVHGWVRRERGTRRSEDASQ